MLRLPWPGSHQFQQSVHCVAEADNATFVVAALKRGDIDMTT